MLPVIYFSSGSGNTARLVEKLGAPALRIPTSPRDVMLEVPEAYVLICPTYSDGSGRGAVAKPVLSFLSDAKNRKGLKGVVGTGNRNFGATFALGGRMVAQKAGVPLIDTIELAGMPHEIAGLQTSLMEMDPAYA
jgi:protein involved in ribonucleotide reduction